MRSALYHLALTFLITAGVSLAQVPNAQQTLPRPRVTTPGQQAIPPNQPAAGSTVSPAAPTAQSPQVPRSVGTINPATDIPSVDGSEQAEANAGLANQAAAAPANSKTWCDIYLSQGSAKDVAVFDHTGTYMADVREINLWTQIAMKVPQVRLTSWSGLYKPTDPAKVHFEDWRVRKILTVPAAEFQQLVTEGVKPAAAK